MTDNELKKLGRKELLEILIEQGREIERLRPTAVKEMTSGDWDLTLFTCTVGGQSRVTVRCEKLKSPSGA